MRASYLSRRHGGLGSRRGFTFIGLLIVILIIGVLTTRQWGTPEDPGIHQIALQRSSNAACMANRNITARGAQMWAFDNPGKVPTIEELRQAGHGAGQCDKAGDWTMLPDGAIHCTYHDDPIDEYILSRFGDTEKAHQILASERIQSVLRAHYPDSDYLLQQ